MLPMRYALFAGEFSTPELSPPTPSPRLPHLWRAVWPAAMEFWVKIAEENEIDPALQAVGSANLEKLRQRQSWLDRLP